MLELRITSSVFLILYFQTAFSLRLYKLNTMGEEDIVPRLKEILDTEKSEQKNAYRKNSIFFKEKPDYRRTNTPSQSFLGKSILVSRIIPHGYHAGPYEYDSKLNTMYKPLIRFHVKKPIKEHEHDILEVITEKPKVLGYVLAVNKEGNEKKSDILTQIKRILRVIKDNKLKNQYRVTDLKKILRQAEGNGDNSEILSKLVDKSLEDVDAYRPGATHGSHHSAAGPYVVIPEYPFWNYWTYHKTIHQDDCPGSLIKLGNVCITPSGHRRFLLAKRY